MRIVHVSAECYPMAKAGGLGDVVGALPKYQQKIGQQAMVVMPMYKTAFLEKTSWDVVHKGDAYLGDWQFNWVSFVSSRYSWIIRSSKNLWL